jgi:vitamin B12 transporter
MGNTERDPYQNTTLQSRFNYKLTDDFDLDWSLRYNQAGTGLDNCGGAGYMSWNGQYVPCDNPYYYSNTNQLYTRGQARWFLFDRIWEQRLGVNFTMSDRQTYYTGAINPNWTPPGINNGQDVKIEWLNFIHILPNDTVTLGMEGKFDSLYSESGVGMVGSGYNSAINNAGYYLQNQLDWFERFHTTMGGRVDDNSRFGSHLTWRFNQTMDVPELDNRIKANIGSAFRAPSLCELSSQCYGNPHLLPETSLDWDAGIEQDLFEKKAMVGVVYFDNNYNNLIQWNPNANGGWGQVQNVSSAIAKGIETFAEYKPISELALRINYTFDETYGQYNSNTGQRTNDPLLLRPKNKGNFDLDYKVTPDVSTHLNVLVNGSRSSFDTNGNIVQVPGYVLVNLSSNYELSKEVTLFARLDNLLNKQYQQVWGYGTLGFYGLGGFTIKF